MRERQPPDIDARLAAVDPGRSFIVQAPAGSGKTSLLTDRVLALLARVQEPEQVVAMTFTRKAAAEMHARVMDKLHRATDDQAPQDTHERAGWALARAVLARDQERGWGLLSHPARLRIQTIDSFSASLVRAMPWLTGLGAMPRIVEDARALYQQAALETVQGADREDCVKELLVHLDLAVGDVVDALAEMLAKRDQWLPLLGHSDDADELQAYLQQAISEGLERIEHAMPVGWQHVLAEPARQAAQALHESGNTSSPIAALLDWQAGSLNADLANLSVWRGLRALLLTNTGTIRKQVRITEGCPSGSPQKGVITDWLKSMDIGHENPVWVDSLNAVQVMPEPVLTLAQQRILNVQLQCLRLAAANLMVSFARRSEVDFIEIAQRAVQALGEADNPSELLLKLDNRIAHLLVDEFQDTSLTQLQLLRLLTAGWQPDDGRTLFLVGDPMQSIYRFRKAEVSLFLQVQEQGIGDVMLEPLTLTANFRSQAGVVDWVNQTFAPMFPERNQPEFGAIRYEPAHAWHAHSGDQAVGWHVMADDAAACARVVEIARQAWQQHAESDKPMAILVRSRSHLGELRRELVNAGLPCRAVELESLQSRSVVIDLLQLTRALVHRGDRVAWLSVLRAPWCGLTLGTLHALFANPAHAICDVIERCLSQASSIPSEIEPDQCSRLRATGAILLAGLRQDDNWPLVARIEATWRALQGPRLVKFDYELQDAQAFFDLVQSVSEFSDIDLDELEQQLAKLYAQPQTAGRAIDVMTMHKAKGLEFETVVLFGLGRKSKADTAPMLRIEQVSERVLFGPIKPKIEQEQDPLSKYLGYRESVRQRFETDRLLYVAATRARQHLHLVAVGKIDQKTGQWAQPDPSSLLARLWQACAQLPAPPALPDKAAEQAKPWWQAPAMRRLQVPISPTEVASPNVLGDRFAWPVTETAERLSGILIHAWLARYARQPELVTRHALPTQAVIEQQLRALGLPKALREDAASEVLEALQAMLASDRGRWLLEQPLRQVEWALIDARQTISIMDLAIELPDGWLVVDYKTSRVHSGESEQAFAARMTARYGAQMARYRQQLQAYDGRAARSVLYFPRDDRWIEVG